MTLERQTATPISQEQILGLLQTRGFETGFQASPLRDFWGTLTSITGEMRQGQRGAFAVSLYNLDEVEVTLLGPSFFRRRQMSEPLEDEVELIRDETGAIKKYIRRRSLTGG